MSVCCHSSLAFLLQPSHFYPPLLPPAGQSSRALSSSTCLSHACTSVVLHIDLLRRPRHHHTENRTRKMNTNGRIVTVHLSYLSVLYPQSTSSSHNSIHVSYDIFPSYTSELNIPLPAPPPQRSHTLPLSTLLYARSPLFRGLSRYYMPCAFTS